MSDLSNFTVINRKGEKLSFDISQIKIKLEKLADVKPKLSVDIDQIMDKVKNGLVNFMKTEDINNYAANVCVGMINEDYAYPYLGARLVVNNLIHDVKKKYKVFSDVPSPKDSAYTKFVKKHSKYLNNLVKEDRNFKYSYMGIMTLKKSYLLRDTKGEIIETPQYLILRVAVNLWCTYKSEEYALKMIEETYNQCSTFKYTHATPTLFNSGTKMNSLISCYLQQLPEDSIEGIYELFKRSGLLQKSAGGLASHIHNMRAIETNISSSNRPCSGIRSPLQLLEKTAQYVDQNRKRPGSNAIYLEPWHYEILTFLEMANPFTPDELSALDLFYAVYLNDYFMKCVEEDDYWYLMCPHVYPGLSDVYGEDFVDLYLKYTKKADPKLIVTIEKKSDYTYLKHKHGQIIRIKARVVMDEILKLMIESGKPYILNKDSINRKNAQKNLGVIKSSNLCCEITLYSDKDETATCCLASIKVSEFYNQRKRIFDWEGFGDTVRVVVRNLNRVLDINKYPTDQTDRSSRRHRPIGVGIQDLGGLFMKMKLPYSSDNAKNFAGRMQEFMYYHALKESCYLAKRDGPYESFKGSPASKGILQFDMWNSKSVKFCMKAEDWISLKTDIMKYGLRNSTLLANMPTASTSCILDSDTEAFYPMVGTIYTRKVTSGEYTMMCRPLVDDLKSLGLWNKKMAETIAKKYDGKIGSIDSIPKDIRELYATVYEFGNKDYIDLLSRIGPFCDQSMSMNIYPSKPDSQIIYNIIAYAWKKDLKTLCYYTRTDPATKAMRNMSSDSIEEKKDPKKKKKWVCNGEEGCVACSS